MSKLNYATADEMPAVLSLPSGLKLPTAGLIAHTIFPDGTCAVSWSHEHKISDQRLQPHDAAALHSALSRFGYEADAPTLKGEDRDGDGVAGE